MSQAGLIARKSGWLNEAEADRVSLSFKQR